MKFQTADLCDSYQNKLQVADPILYSYGGNSACYGQITTIKLDEDNSALVALLKSDGKGRIAVVDAQAKYCAIVGDTLMGFASKNNWRGIIVNGYVRDTQNTKDIPVGLWAIGTCPRKSTKKAPAHTCIELNFANIIFKEGAYLYADADGIVVSQEELLQASK